MEMFGKILCVTRNELVLGGIVSPATYDKYVNNGKFVVARRGCRNREALIIYEKMPEPILKTYDSKNPKAKELLQELLQKQRQEQLKQQVSSMDSRLKSDSKAVDFYKTYTPKISLERQREYVLNAKVLNAMIAKEAEISAEHSKCGFSNPKIVKKAVLALCEYLREQHKHTLPKSESRLMEKYAAYKKYGYVVLVSGTTGNQCARKIGPKEGRLLLKLKRSKFPVYTDMQIFEEYNRQAEAKGLRKIESPQTVINYLYKTGIQLWWYGIVYGEVAFKNKFMPQFDTKLPEMPNTLWYGDGTKVNLYYKEYDKKQKRMVARTIDVYEVMDACTEVFLGYSFGQENFLTQYEAYRMALETWKVKPYEIVTDNQGGHKKPEAQAFFKKICHLHKTTMPHNGQSKTIESAFGRFQQQVLHKLYNYSGQNITAVKENSHVNIDLLMMNISRLPTLEEMKAQYIACREEWNRMEHPTSETGMTRIEMYTTLNSPNAELLDEYEVQELFKLLSKDSVKYNKNGFIFNLNKQEYRYMVYGEDNLVDMNFHMQNVGVSFRYRYDPKDMTAIELWEVGPKGALKYAATATPKVVIHRATADRTSEESEHLFAQIHAQKRALAGHYIASEELLLEECMSEAYTNLIMPRPVGESAKSMERYREEYAEERLCAPVEYPEGMGPGTYVPEEETVSINSVDEYTKEVSKLTDIDLYEGFFGNNA